MPHLTTPLAVRAIDGITTRDELADHLGDAARIELSTIPPYPYAAYSLKTPGYSQRAQGASAQRTLIGIAIEEMLHMALVRNVMVATGCETVKTKDGNQRKASRFYDKDSIPTYPGDMSHRTPPLPLHLQRISTAAVEGFMEVELPETAQQQLLTSADDYSYQTLGELYDAIGKGIVHLTGTKDITWGLTESRWQQQYLRAFWNQWGGPPKPIPVVDQGSALDALYIIVSQGEGAPDEQEESHYEKFTRIRDHVDGIGVVCDDSGRQKYTIDSGDEAVWPVVTDPNASDFTGSLKQLALLSDAAYCYVLALLDKLYLTPADDPDSGPGQGEPHPTSKRYALERGFIAAMQGVLSPVANILVSTPLTDGPNAGRHAGPTFGHYDFQGVPPRQALLDLCTDKDLATDFPQLGGSDGVLNQIRLLPDFTI
ncbi:ferritin-like domain-containing protein [Streptomyces halobius]|uniref:Ferritin-like protein n=1 Tax=Streptomyces halobius TaxID=2879846 RepID=A0ABY4M2I7_9ACTN|nr:ferritin-like protein [Streptomyces halobius]UQA91985.1 ferritin-like protein [Streptomyces halobius]